MEGKFSRENRVHPLAHILYQVYLKKLLVKGDGGLESVDETLWCFVSEDCRKTPSSFVLRVSVRKILSKGPRNLGQNKNSKAEVLYFYQDRVGISVISTVQNLYRHTRNPSLQDRDRRIMKSRLV